MRPLDTNRDAHLVQLRVYQRMSPAERVQLAIEMSDQAHVRSAAGIRTRHPEYDDRDVEWASRRLQLGDPLFRSAWPDAPLVDP